MIIKWLGKYEGLCKRCYFPMFSKSRLIFWYNRKEHKEKQAFHFTCFRKIRKNAVGSRQDFGSQRDTFDPSYFGMKVTFRKEGSGVNYRDWDDTLPIAMDGFFTDEHLNKLREIFELLKPTKKDKKRKKK